MFVAARPFLTGEDAPWIDVERLRLGELHVRALEAYAASTLGVGGTELSAAVRAGRKLVALEPYRESGHRILMEALDREGNPAEALLVYEALRTKLRDDLGVNPSPPTQAAPSPPAGLTPSSASLAASCSASFFDRPFPVPTTSASMIAAAVNERSCGGTFDLDGRVGDRTARAREPLLQLRLVVDERRQRVFDARLERLDDRRLDRLEAVLEVERSERRLEQCREHVAVPRELVGVVRALAAQALAELELPRDDRAAGPRDDVRAHLRHPALRERRETVVEGARDHELEHRVPEELEPLVRGGAVGGPRGMREDRRRPVCRELVDQLPQRFLRLTGAR